MKKNCFSIGICFFALCAITLSASAQESSWHEQRTLRLDFYHAGDAASECYWFDELVEEPYWAGSENSLVDSTDFGGQQFRIVDPESGTILYKRGYNTLFNEWQTVDEARTMKKAMPESVRFPWPKEKVLLQIFARDKKNRWSKRYEQLFDPASPYIRRFSPRYETFEVFYNGEPAHKIDVVLIPEGYSAEEKEAFKKACDNFVKSLFSYTPYRENRSKFNVRAVWAPSEESGVTLPGEGIWRRTVTGASFYTFGVERYQMIEDQQRLAEIAAHVPYEYVYVLSNTQKYGGGGIYNFYGISSANHPSSTGAVYVHEFGHLFAGQGDEYVGGVAYNDLYPQGVEPWEANLTTLTDFKSKEWSRMLDPKTPVPTPLDPAQADLLGVYEGGGYVSKGVYRPLPNCLMNNLHTTDRFCPVCEQTIRRQIEFLCR